MTCKKISIQERTERFAIRAYGELSKKHFDDAGRVLAKQFLRAEVLGRIMLRVSLLSQLRILFLSILLL